jgi:hypothetical protein
MLDPDTGDHLDPYSLKYYDMGLKEKEKLNIIRRELKAEETKKRYQKRSEAELMALNVISVLYSRKLIDKHMDALFIIGIIISCLFLGFFCGS